MPGSPTELIKEKLDIVEFLRGYLLLYPAGKNFKALCPFHREKTPSFMISPDRQSWHCFGCALGGDIFAFLMRHENIEFGEALRVLAERAGVELRRLNPAEYKYTGLLHEINEEARVFFEKRLESFAKAKEYLAARKLKRETIEEFQLGWAPNEQESLGLHLVNRGFSPEDALQAGLIFKTDRGMVIDRFRGRIMFPIHNHFGKVAGFTGRVLSHEGPESGEGTQNPSASSGLTAAKYVNSPETPIFQKSRLLYGFFKSKNFIRESESAFLVEGQMDFLMSWQSGARNVVATSGTALTIEHLRTLRRATDTLIVSFDADEAGLRAGERAIDLAEENDFEVKIAHFEKHKDPAEAAEHDPKTIVRAIEQAEPVMKFYFRKYLPEGAASLVTREKVRNIRAVLGKIKKIASPITQGFWLAELARYSGLDEKVLRDEAEKLKDAAQSEREPAGEGNPAVPEKNVSRRERISHELVSLAVTKNDFASLEDSIAYFAHPYGEVFTLLRSGGRSSGNPLFDEVLDLVVLQAGRTEEGDFLTLKQELFKEYVKEKRQELAQAVRRAEEAGNERELRTALEELNMLSSVL
ncbi:DNA primase [Candidatus Parcubacteria bacterium]|nr:MAG: DNA primase [Candidatus Parcubacteria bacterium]